MSTDYVYIIEGETGELYNGTLMTWRVGYTLSEEEAKRWVEEANNTLISFNLHKSSPHTDRFYKKTWKPAWDPNYQYSYNGVNYWWWKLDKLNNYFEEY